MGLDSVLTLAVAVLLFGASPGPGIFAVVARALSAGFRPAIALSAGLIIGDLVWLTAAASGLAVIAQAMGEFFIVLKIAGGLYLAWLGVKAWRSRPEPLDATTTTTTPARRQGVLATVAGGVAVTLSNPKAILFYLAILPTILDLNAITLPGLLTAGAVVVVVLLAVCGAYALLAARARTLLRSEAAMRRLNRTSGVLLIGAGVAVATR
ncbi:LysE family translocator [Novispirillum sp. DQ9]|uniref:LysE family translocator n=1 Tax=Novispirillum sp. DQ9 TaxID=3398612 RepID=UPI003C7CC2B7